jgi:hypothetical protein
VAAQGSASHLVEHAARARVVRLLDGLHPLPEAQRLEHAALLPRRAGEAALEGDEEG